MTGSELRAALIKLGFDETRGSYEFADEVASFFGLGRTTVRRYFSQDKKQMPRPIVIAVTLMLAHKVTPQDALKLIGYEWG